MKKTVVAASVVFFAILALAQSEPSPPPSQSAGVVHRVQVDAATASSLILQKAPVKYPDAARDAGVQGKVELKVVIGTSGDVIEATVVSGDPALAQAAVGAVKQWKYKPYIAEGSVAEMETRVRVNFQIPADSQPAAPPPGKFLNDAYLNDYFAIFYPLSRDWVRQTEVVRTKLASGGNSKGSYVLLAAVHIPRDTDPLRADPSFTVLALTRSGQDCKQYLEVGANDVSSQKAGKQKGEVGEFSVAGHDFFRADFEYRNGPDHRTFLCTSIKDYLLLWNIVGWSKQAIEVAVATVNSIAPAPPAATPSTEIAENKADPTKVRVPSGISTGLLLKKFTPVYPQEAKSAGIQGQVVLQVVINKMGDVVDLEALSGPIDLVVSAVNAVRKWKYRPYLLNGEPISVETQIVVNYTLSRF